MTSDRTTILVVDDEPKIARLIRHVFPASSFEVLSALDGSSAVTMVEDERPDLVLLDVMMPGMDGLQACRRIREISDVPIIMVTARRADDDRIRGLDLGADDYVTKPFSPDVLAARVRAVLRRAHPESKQVGPTFDDGTLKIDFERREVALNGELVRLSRTEMRLLQVLAGNANRVFLHDELKARVWGEDYVATNEQLRTYVKYVRRKIEPTPENPRYLLSQPGIGYVFRALPSAQLGAAG